MSVSRLHPAISSTLPFDGRYELVAFLGGGAFGEVWEATDTTTGRTVALKLIDPNHTTPDAAWREATHLTSLASPNGTNVRFLVAVHGAAMSSLGVPYIDMALVGDCTESLASPNGVSESTAARWAQRVARGLDLCHGRGLLHRDVKPANILLSRTGDALLGDFGLTAVMSTDGTADPHGDGHVMAPEVFGGRCSVRSDVYSLGVTLYYLVTGGYPHRLVDHNNDWLAFEAAVKTGIPDVRDTAPHLSLGLAKTIRTATATDPAERYPTATGFDKALAQLNSPRRVIMEVSPCQPGGRCWSAEPGLHQALRPVHVCAWRKSSGKFEIQTRHEGGQRMKAQCLVTLPGQLVKRLQSVFRALL